MMQQVMKNGYSGSVRQIEFLRKNHSFNNKIEAFFGRKNRKQNKFYNRNLNGKKRRKKEKVREGERSERDVIDKVFFTLEVHLS